MPDEVTLVGINGSNPLGFLASLGAFRALNAAFPKDGILMGWKSNGAWNPVIRASRNINEQVIVETITSNLCEDKKEPIFGFGDDLKIKPEDYRKYSRTATRASSLSQRDWADFVAAFGCDLLVGEDGYIQDTHLRTMSGAGHQHFVKNMRNIIGCTESHHIRKALFEIWQYDDPLENLSMRWDPMDDQRYATRWSNPSGDSTRKRRGSMLGANRLAIEALPLVTLDLWNSLIFENMGNSRFAESWLDLSSFRVVLGYTDSPRTRSSATLKLLGRGWDWFGWR